MRIKYKNQCELIGSGPLSYISGDLQTCQGGMCVVNEDGTLLSVQPNGDVDNRPAGTTPGSYEICQPDLSVNTLNFNPAGVPYRLAYCGQ